MRPDGSATALRLMLRSAVQLTRPGLVADEAGTTSSDFADAATARRWLDLEYGSVVMLIIESARRAESSVDRAAELLRDIQSRL